MDQHTFIIGERTPFGPLPQGAGLAINPKTQALVISLPEPTPAKISMLRRGRLRVGLAGPLEPGGAVLVAWHFEPLTRAGRGLWFDSPLHIGRNPTNQRALADRARQEPRRLLLVIQDEAARFCGGRAVTLSPRFCAALEDHIAAQAQAAQEPGWNYLTAAQKVLNRWSGPEAALQDAAFTEIAGRARWTGEMAVSTVPVS